MSAHALSPRPADFLPPSLQPHAIADAAPGSDRRLSFLVSCCIYSALVAGVAFTARSTGMLKSPILTTTSVIFEPNVEPTLEMPVQTSVAPAGGPAAPSVKTSQVEELPPVPTNLVPESIGELPSLDLSKSTMRGSDPNGMNVYNGVTGPVGPPPTVTTQGTYRPTLLEIEPSAVRVLHSVQPSYPTLARLARVQGPVVLQLTIDAQGVPTDVKVVSSPHTALEGESMRVARLWRFAPATADGHPIAATFKLTLNYVLR